MVNDDNLGSGKRFGASKASVALGILLGLYVPDNAQEIITVRDLVCTKPGASSKPYIEEKRIRLSPTLFLTRYFSNLNFPATSRNESTQSSFAQIVAEANRKKFIFLIADGSEDRVELLTRLKEEGLEDDVKIFNLGILEMDYDSCVEAGSKSELK